uniref:Craniofacial development protein 2-like n=1 Tax=Nicotiana tabacum TaxID=4097 RepID=A0A1S4A890_TOBAC|nr:PREDICTED: craniofacial development protein 2-like [Nicotiana tabacum]
MRVDDRLMTIKLVIGGFTLNTISAYAPQAGLDEEVKRRFWEDLDEMVRGIPHNEKLFIGEDFNDHIGAASGGYDDVYGGFGFGDRNGGGTSLLDFARAFDLVIANSSLPKKREYLVTFRSSVAETQLDYLLCRKYDRGLCTDCKVIPRKLRERYQGSQRVTLMVTKETGGGMERCKEMWKPRKQRI